MIIEFLLVISSLFSNASTSMCFTLYDFVCLQHVGASEVMRRLGVHELNTGEPREKYFHTFIPATTQVAPSNTSKRKRGILYVFSSLYNFHTRVVFLTAYLKKKTYFFIMLNSGIIVLIFLKNQFKP